MNRKALLTPAAIVRGSRIVDMLAESLSANAAVGYRKDYARDMDSLKWYVKVRARDFPRITDYEAVVVIIALASFNRTVITQLRGAARFARRVLRSSEIDRVRFGSSTLDASDVTDLTRITTAFSSILSRYAIPPWFLEYADLFSLLRTINSSLTVKDGENDGQK